jgi:polysaccharide export outer membrane protein
MLKSKPLLFAILIMMGTSCIPRKRLIYLQDKGTELELSEDGHMKIARSLYKLQQGDMLMITIKSLDEDANKLFRDADFGGMMQGGGFGGMPLGGGDFIFFLMGQTIDSEGKIKIPVLGDLKIEGLTEEEVQKLIDQRLALYFKESTVFSRVRQAGIRFSIVGEVNRPGRHVIMSPYVNIIEALAYAGDIGFVGDRRQVQIVRLYPEGYKVFEVDLTDQAIINDPLFFIQPNDIIQVRPLRQKTFGVGTTGFQTISGTVGVLTSTLTLIFLLTR